MPLVDDEAQGQSAARQGALFKALHAHHAGLVDLDGAGVACAVRRGGRAVDRIAQHALALELQHDFFHTLKDAVGREIARLCADTAQAPGILLAGRGFGKVEETVLPVHTAVAAAGGDVPQACRVHQLAGPVPNIELFMRGIEGKARAGRVPVEVRARLLTHEEDYGAAPELRIRHPPEERLALLVGEIVVRQAHRLVGNVLDLHPVAFPGVARHREAEVPDCRLADHPRARGDQGLLPGLIAVGRVRIARRRIEALRPVSVRIQGHGHICRAAAAGGTVHGGIRGVIEIDAVVFREGKVHVHLIVEAVFPRGEEQQPFPGPELHGREGPAVAAHPVGNAAALQIDRLVRDIGKLDPVGVIPVLIPDDTAVFFHQLRDAQLPHQRGHRLRLGRRRGACLRRRSVRPGAQGVLSLKKGSKSYHRQHQHGENIQDRVIALVHGHLQKHRTVSENNSY